MNRLKRGFTLVELIVVIAVIGILAAVTVIGLSRYQADTRDTRRASSVAVIAEALEKYYDENGEYPSCTDVMAAADTLTTTTLIGINKSAIVAPQAASGQTNTIECTPLTLTNGDWFEYEGDGSAACSGSGSCLEYTLKYKSETTGEIKELASRRNTSIATSGAPTLSQNSVGFDNVSLGWTTVANASSYLVERSATSNFAAIQQSYQVLNGATSLSATGLNSNTTYYFRVRPNATNSSGTWSNVLTATTLNLATPTGFTAVANSNSQITTDWNDTVNATSYDISYSTASNMAGATTYNVTSSTRVFTGLSTGVTYYFQVLAKNASFSSSPTSIINATTFVPAPTCLTATTNSSTQITASWSACPVAVATSYTIQRSTVSDFSSGVTTVTGITATSYVATGLQQGTLFYWRVYALVNATSSTASPTANATTTVNAPTSVSVSANDTGSVRAYAAGDWIQWNDSPASGNWYYAWGTGSGSCPSGTTRQFRFGANYTSPTTFLGWTGWETTSTKYRVSPNSGYGVRFHVEARCVGSAGNVSSTVGATSGYVY